jgi:hypothetical protein
MSITTQEGSVPFPRKYRAPDDTEKVRDVTCTSADVTARLPGSRSPPGREKDA